MTTDVTARASDVIATAHGVLIEFGVVIGACVLLAVLVLTRRSRRGWD